MNEQEWLACNEPALMLRYLEGRASDRKMRLFACACAREVEPETRGSLNFSVPKLAEWYADVQAEVIEIVDASAEVQDAAYLQTHAVGSAFGVLEAALDLNSYQAATQAAMWLNGYYSDEDSASRLRPATFCRDIFGNPFRTVTVERSWLTSDVVALAASIYADHAFDRMPILADALQDAGCDNNEVLDHCRGPGPHVRGCYVLDLILGKS